MFDDFVALVAVYLLIGLVFMVLTLTVFYEIPQLNVGNVFLLKSDDYMANSSAFVDSEKSRLQVVTAGVAPPVAASAAAFTNFGSTYLHL